MTLMMVATSALTAFLFHLPFLYFSCSCVWCVCACLCVSLRHVSGVEQLHQVKASDWRNREHVVLDLFSNFEMGKILW